MNDDLGSLVGDADFATASNPISVVPQTVFLIPPRGLVEVSSSMVKGLVGASPVWQDAVGRYVTPTVLESLSQKHTAAQKSEGSKSSTTKSKTKNSVAGDVKERKKI